MIAGLAMYIGARILFDLTLGRSDIAGMTPAAVAWADGEIAFFAAGDPNAQRVVFVHGTPGAAANFSAFLRDPLAGFESVTIDRPGFGKSKPRRAVPGLADQAKAIEPFLVERNGKWPILVGHSLGGPIVAQVAADYPDRVGGIVIVAGSLDPDLEKVLAVQHVGDWPVVRHLLPRILRNSNRELIRLKAELETLQPRLATIECTVVVLHGDQDGLVPVDNVPFMQAHFAQDALHDVVILEGGNHFLPWNAESAIRDAIRKAAETPVQPIPETNVAG